MPGAAGELLGEPSGLVEASKIANAPRSAAAILSLPSRPLPPSPFLPPPARPKTLEILSNSPMTLDANDRVLNAVKPSRTVSRSPGYLPRVSAILAIGGRMTLIHSREASRTPVKNPGRALRIGSHFSRSSRACWKKSRSFCCPSSDLRNSASFPVTLSSEPSRPDPPPAARVIDRNDDPRCSKVLAS